MNKVCNSKEIQQLINSTKNGGVCVLPKKEYYLTETVVIKDKENIVIDGNGTEILTRYYNNKEHSYSTDAFIIDGCKNITFKNMKINADKPTNIAATVEDFNIEEHSLIIRIDDCFEINGDEELITFDSIDKTGDFNWQTHHYNIDPDESHLTVIGNEIFCFKSFIGAKKEYLGDNKFKVYLYHDCIFNPYVGQRICIRHSLYGPDQISGKNSDDTLIKDITMNRVPGFAISIFTRCNNITIDGLNISQEEGSASLMSSNLDGIHIAGATGKVIVKNSYFKNLGDDIFNIHSTAGTATEIIDNNKIRCNYCKKRPNGALPVRWCEKGDIIRAYNPETLEMTATFKVVSFENEILTFENLKGDFKEGFMLQNVAMAPDCVIDNVVAKGQLGRAFCLQTDNIEVKNCSFENIPYISIIMAPAFVKWYEVGPIKNAYIHNNTFKNCARIGAATIIVSNEHNHYPDGNIRKLHKNIRIENNVFEGNSKCFIRVGGTENITVFNNQFKGKTEKGVFEAISCEKVEKDI